MPRSVNSVASRARRKRILKETRGNFGARANVWTVAKNTYEKGRCSQIRRYVLFTINWFDAQS